MYINTTNIKLYLTSSFVIAAASFIFFTPQASATIKVEGDREFRDEVNDCIITYRTAPGIVGDTIRELERSTNEHRIINNTSWSCAANNWEDASDGDGTGSVTKVDKAELERLKESIPALRNKDFCTGLLHELSHAADADRGERDPTREDGVKKNEIKATLFQNFVHAIRGVDPRTSYGGIDISHIVLAGDVPVVETAGELEVKPEPKAEPKTEPKKTETVKLDVIKYNSMYVPVGSLKLYTKKECNCCDSDHYHSPTGSARSTDGKVVADPYSNCGIGKTSSVVKIDAPAK